MRRLSWALILVLSVFGTSGESKDWKGIIPCISSRLEVQRILGKDSPPANLGIYRYKKFRVHVLYEKKDNNDRNKDIVIKIDVYPDTSKTLSKYIERIPNFHRDFPRTEVDRVHTYSVVYSNSAEGFEIWVTKNDKDVEVIDRFRYSPLNDSCVNSPR